MNRSDFWKMDKNYRATKDLLNQIESLERLVRAIERRVGKEVPRGTVMELSVKLKTESYSNYCHVEVPNYLIGEALLPPLRGALKNLREDFKALPVSEVRTP